MGNLYKRGSLWWLQYRQHGRLMRESSGSSKEHVARRMLRVREGDVEHGIPIVPKRDRITFDDAAEDLLNDYRTNGKRSLKVAATRSRGGSAASRRRGSRRAVQRGVPAGSRTI